MASEAPGNGEFWRELYVWCGNTAVPIRKLGTDGQPVTEPVKESKGA